MSGMAKHNKMPSGDFIETEQSREYNRKQGELRERKRIIKLLENPKCKPNDHDYNGGCNCDAIALIKGESNE